MSRSTNESDEDGTNPKYHSESSFVDEGNIGSSDGVVALKKGPWTASEDAILVDYVKKHGEGNWNAVQKHSGLIRCGKSCRLRWANHLRPNLKKGAFTPEEEALILELHLKLGNKWARMASHLPGRTDNEIKNYWNTRIKRRQRAGLDMYPPEYAQRHSQNQLGQNPCEGTPQDLMHARLEIPEVKFENFHTRTTNDVLNYYQGYQVWVMRASAQYYNVAPTAHRQKRARESYDVNAGFVDQYQSDTCYALQGGHSLTNNGNNSSASFAKSELPSLQYSEADFGAPVPKSADGGSTQLSFPSNRLSPLHSGTLEMVVLEAKRLCSGDKRLFEEIHNEEASEGFIDIPETEEWKPPETPLISSSSLLLGSGVGRSEAPARFGLPSCAFSESHANPESLNGNENCALRDPHLADEVIKCYFGEDMQIGFDDVASGISPAGGYGDCAWNSMPSASDDFSGGT